VETLRYGDQSLADLGEFVFRSVKFGGRGKCEKV
jgi:hypothetical protein